MNKINLAIGFVTGRKNFKNLVKTYVNSWNEHNLITNERINLHLMVAYDLKYRNTKVSDYKRIDPEIFNWLDSVNYIGYNTITNEIKYLTDNGVVNRKEARMVFGDGYGKKRNIVTYFAIKNKMDRLLFLDDDEYPVAVIKTPNNGINWLGQSVVSTHLKYINDADITHGYHCGYISPIPYLEFDKNLTEDDFRIFIETISNDIISWESIKNKMQNGGITYAEEAILYEKDMVEEVKEINKCKFISGSNLCLNLRNKEKLAPFYNPPDARGEDTFLSTSLSRAKVLKVPCYTFHDGFLNYSHLLHGVLPRALKPVKADSRRIVARFVKASIGWVRYKPLLLYITKRQDYESEIKNMKEQLEKVIPKLCRYFNTNEFMQIRTDLDYYDRNVKKHYQNFEQTKEVWNRIVSFVREDKC